MRESPTVETLRALFAYDAVSGALVRLRTGRLAGATNAAGYRQATVNGRLFYVHRIAWAMVHGEWPVGHIDHINLNKSDNRIANLRVVDGRLNGQNRLAQRNNKTGAKGVSFGRNGTRFHACIRVDGKTIHLGNHKTLEGAAAAYRAAAAIHHTVNPLAG